MGNISISRGLRHFIYLGAVLFYGILAAGRALAAPHKTNPGPQKGTPPTTKISRTIDPHLTAQITNGILTVDYETSGPEIGQFWVSTGPNHPTPDETIFFQGTTSYITLRDVNSRIMWYNADPNTDPAPGLTGYRALSMTGQQATITSTGNSFTVTYNPPGFQVVQKVSINGNSVSDSNVLQEVSVKNTTAAPRQIGMRYLWDWEIAGVDASFFRTRLPDSSFSNIFRTFTNPTFPVYEEVDNPQQPMLHVFGTVQSSLLNPPTVPPEQLRYCGFADAFSSAWDFPNTGSALDSAVTYFWGFNTPITVSPGATASFRQYLTTVLQAVVPPRLAITKTAPASVRSGSNLTYTITYGNVGATQATGATVSDQLPAGTSFVSATNGGVLSGNTVRWNVGNIPPNTNTRTVSFTVRVNATSGNVINSNYSLAAPNTASATGRPVSTAVIAASLRISKTAAASTPINSDLTYTLTYGNAGNAAINQVVVSDPLPAGTTFVAASNGGALSGNSVNWSLGTLVPGANGTLNFTVHVGDAASSITNANYSISGSGAAPAGGAPVTTTVPGGGAIPVATQIVAAGGCHSLYVGSTGNVSAWGYNGAGQLGNNTRTNSNRPVTVLTASGVVLSDAQGVAAGWYHSLALRRDGSVYAWGLNTFGQLGDSSTSNRMAAVPVTGLSNIRAVAAGVYHSLALDAQGRVWAWGSNFYGQLGNGTHDSGAHTTPALVVGLLGNGERAIAIAAGAGHSAVVIRNSAGQSFVRAWGWNYYGQLGNGTSSDSEVPVTVGSLTGITAIAAGYAHTLALNASGGVIGWGNDSYGQLGNGIVTDTAFRSPVAVQNLSGVTNIAAGAGHSLALRSDRTIWAWGSNSYGQLGDNTLVNRSLPVQVHGQDNIGFLTSVQPNLSAGYAHSLAIRSVQPPAWDWGYNFYGQLGNASNTDSHTPVPVSLGLGISAGSLYSSVSADATANTVTLRFTRALNSTVAGDLRHYTVTVNGTAVTVQRVSYLPASNSVQVALASNALAAGSPVAIRWSGLLDTNGAAVADGTAAATAH